MSDWELKKKSYADVAIHSYGKDKSEEAQLGENGLLVKLFKKYLNAEEKNRVVVKARPGKIIIKLKEG